MSTPLHRLAVRGSSYAFAPGEEASFRRQLAAAIGIGLFVCLLGTTRSSMLAVAAPLGLLFVVGPSRFSLSVFLVCMAASHQYLSPVTMGFAGVEWHPREILLGGLLAHWAVKAIQGKLRLTPDVVDAAMLLMGLHFVFTALVGLAASHDLHEIIEECRYPAFLLCYPVFATLATTRSDLRFYSGVLVALTVAIALASTGFFVYTLTIGTPVQLNQTVLGEFMKASVGPYVVQAVRPNGHLFFEVLLVVLCGLVLTPGLAARRRILCVAGIGLLGFAVLITSMRTAYVTVAVSLALLLFLLLPSRRAQLSVAAAACAFGLLYLALFGFPPADSFTNSLQQDLSLQGRVIETQGAWRAFLPHPIVGNGMGSSFEGLGLVQTGEQLAAAPTTFQTIHNVWMYYLFKGGVLGFALVAVGLGAVFLRGYSLTPTLSDPVERAILRGVVAAFGGQLVASLAMPRFIYPSGYVFVAMVAWFVCRSRQMAAAKEL